MSRSPPTCRRACRARWPSIAVGGRRPAGAPWRPARRGARPRAALAHTTRRQARPAQRAPGHDRARSRRQFPAERPRRAPAGHAGYDRTARRRAGVTPAATPPLAVEIGEVAVQDGRMTWRDETVSPVARLDVSGLDASVTGVGWPLRGPLSVRAGHAAPGRRPVQVAGRVGLEPLTADLRVRTNNAELAPYQPYVPIAARVGGAADMDVAVVVAPPAEQRATVRGSAALSRVDVRDGERTVARVERATATGLELDWPQRLAIKQLALVRPWLLVERDHRAGCRYGRCSRPRQASPAQPRPRTPRPEASRSPSASRDSPPRLARSASSIARSPRPSPWICSRRRCR